ncbi:MAG: hypothetical protein IPP31_07210 [Chitinophagaceae bacterium]|nr:hypothetical protein [Chitinophagaceae bacterium]
MRIVFFYIFLCLGLTCRAQEANKLIPKSVNLVYEEYKTFFDSNLLGKHVILDSSRSYFMNSGTQKIRAITRMTDDFAFDGMNLSFAIVYKGDTLTHLTALVARELILVPLGSPGNPRRHGDILPPYLELVKGRLGFDYKQIKQWLSAQKLEGSNIELVARPADPKDPVAWKLTRACPEVRCPQLEISAMNGKILSGEPPH